MAKAFTFFNGVSIKGSASAPADIANGDIYYNTTTNTFRQYVNGAESDLGGGGGGGSSAEVTGAGKSYWGTSAPTGWVFASGNTIGNASSNATARANADTSDLFTLLWNSTTNTQLQLYNSSGSPISRGGSAASDFAANNALALPDKRGRISVGKDNMGGTTASRITSAGSGVDGTILATAGGEETHTLVSPELPSHSHPITDQNHSHPYNAYWQNVVAPQPLSGIPHYGNVNPGVLNPGPVSNPTSSPSPANLTANPQGSGAAHQNTQPTQVNNYIIKL